MSTKPFLISRTFDLPKSLAWKYWTNVNDMKQWFGPKDTMITHSEMDFREGGSYHYAMQTPDGSEMWGKSYYEKIQPEERVEYINTFSDANGGLTSHPMAPTWPLRLYTIITFEETGPGKTTIHINWLPVDPKPEELETFEAVREGMKQGWTGTFDRFEEFAENSKVTA